MAGELLIFDAAASNVDGTNPGTALNLGPGTNYAIRDFAAPAPPQTVQWAGSVDTEGTLPASRKHENRVISVTVLCATAASLRTLQDKVGKVAREGGTLKWVLPNAETIIFDLHSADTYEPAITKLFYVRTGGFCEVSMSFLARPYGRGAEVDLGDNTETTLPCLIFTDTGVKGDMPGLGRLVVDNDDASNAQRLLRWGIQSRYYSSASTAALFYEAESCAMSAASAAVGPAGASGGGSNTAFFNNLSSSAGWNALHYIGASSTAQTHIGAFRIFARAWAPNTNAGVVSLRSTWAPVVGGTQVNNTGVEIADAAGAAIEQRWVLVDLGQILLPVVKAGTQGWLGTIDGNSTTAGDDVYIDWIMLVPVDEGSGEYVDPTTTSPQIPASGTAHIRFDGALAASGGYLSPLREYEGDYLLIPPAGAEARTVRVIVKMSRDDTSPGSPVSTGTVFLDPGTDDISARLFYTPRWLVVPEP